MAVLGSAVALLGALTVLNLVLTYGIIRKLPSLAPARPAGPVDAGSVGTVAGDFSVHTADGSVLTRQDLPDGALVGFFSPGCEPCTELLPRFSAAVRDLRISRAEVLAVIAPGTESPHPYADELGDIARLAVGGEAARIAEAFGITGYPVVCRVASDGSVTVIDRELRALGVRAAG
ncbi:TlpA family protein disulfide reductase [Streptomyces sp. NPDC088864]|uniref:TlpA family protein disulfide reductase n=1 Tax=Streptomyces sp. NPDC088864 TaxID=3365910 RepID=UPI0037F8AAFE